ncbi:MAG: flagellar biosynthesis protein FlhA [Gammaproteobacteria bacterium]|nr:MAG: flagellar biosynthesis protein FlhA [Gammaproteobacteria bacterium]
MAQASTLPTLGELSRNGLGTPILLMMLLGMMIVPMPSFLLDVLFTFNIALALVVVLAAVYTLRPLEFASFPTVLLLATLLRLSLNIASTRIVLLKGHTGTDAAGKVIESFGEFVIGGNYAVGLVVFAVLVIINFIVVTKGAGRVSEVSARFTLDAMPGKQMAIDADLNAGIIDQDEARRRRDDVSQEADFYGSMDGASKFVRGDAIAGILILFINIIGGLGIGMVQHGMRFSSALENYTSLTIGDGLVAQIPSLVLSTAAAIMVTRVSQSQDMGAQILKQLFGAPRALAVTAGVMGMMGMIPGMPNIAFLSLAAIAGTAAWMIIQKQRQQAVTAEQAPATLQEATPEPKELSWDDVTPVDMIGLEVGYRLIPMVDKKQGGQLINRIKGVRKKLSQELGFLVPAVHIRDNLSLAPNVYRISLMGTTIAESEVHPERDLAINPGQVYGKLEGLDGKDPAFGLDAVWVEQGQREHAQTLGYTVVDASTVIATHLSQLLQTHAHELLSYEDVQQLLDKLKLSAPRLVEDLVPDRLPLSVIHKVMQNLLQEKVPVRDIRTIAETLAEQASVSQDSGVLTAAVRVALGRAIVQQINDLQEELTVITLDPALEQLLQQSAQSGNGEAVGLEPGLADRMLKALAEHARQQELNGLPAVLLVPAPLRPVLARFVRHGMPELHILSYNEVPDSMRIKVVATVGGNV